jgi:uncharacterized membrane protein
MLKTSIIDIKTLCQFGTLHSTFKKHYRSQLLIRIIPGPIPPFPPMPSLPLSILRILLRLLLAALFLFAGTVHLCDPELFLPITPPWIPFHLPCILISGVVELVGGLGLLLPVRPIQVAIGWMLTLLLIAVFPANLHMAMANVKIHGFPAQPWMGWARLPFQPLLIIAVLWLTQIWPGKCKK